MSDNTKPTWETRIHYDERFATVGLQQAVIFDDQHQEVSPVTSLRISDMLARVPRSVLLALLQERYHFTEGSDDINPARVRMLEETDWKNKVVLDIGGYDGFAAEIAHKGGASRAICLDNHQYEHYGWDDKRKDGVEYIQGDVMRLTLDQTTEWLNAPDNWSITSLDLLDVIINYNVLYHVKNPWAFLDKCRDIIKPDGEMLLCTLFRYHDGAWMYVYEPRECNPTDDTVYFGPSLDAIERLLKATGWEATQYALAFDRVLYRCKPIAGFTRTHEDT